MSVDATKFVWKLSKQVVTPVEKLILLAIADRCGERGECWPSISRLCKDTNLSADAVRRHRHELIAKGILTYTGKYEGRSKQIPIMKMMVDEWREGKYVEEKIDPPAVATPSQESGVPPLDSQGYPPAVASQNLKEEPKQESKEKIYKKEKSPALSISELEATNPYEIPHQMIVDFFTVRKAKRAPITPTAWQRLNSQLEQCKQKGVEPIQAFATMVDKAWISLEADWFKMPTTKKSHFNNESTDWAKGIEQDLF